MSRVVGDLLTLLILLILLMTLTRSLNVLLLHGKGGSANKFKEKLKPLTTAFNSNTWHFIDAPYTLPRDRIRLNTEKRGINSSTDDIDDLAWWLLPEGVRSFEATSYEGVEKSIDIIEQHIKSKKIDVLVGHSQGAMIATVITARSLLRISEVQLKGSIISSAAWPLPYDHLLEDLRKSKTTSMITIHTIGFNDKVNPPAHSRRIADCFKSSTDVHIVDHEGGHVLPLSSAAFSAYSKLFK